MWFDYLLMEWLSQGIMWTFHASICSEKPERKKFTTTPVFVVGLFWQGVGIEGLVSYESEHEVSLISYLFYKYTNVLHAKICFLNNNVVCIPKL